MFVRVSGLPFTNQVFRSADRTLARVYLPDRFVRASNNLSKLQTASHTRLFHPSIMTSTKGNNHSNSQSNNNSNDEIKHPYFWEKPHSDTLPLKIAVYQCVSVPQTFEQALAKLKDMASSLGAGEFSQHTHETATQSIKQSIRPTVDLLVLPELWLCGYDIHKSTIRKSAISLHSKEMKQIQEICKKNKIAIALGYSEKSNDESDDESSHLYNSAVTIDSDGSIAHNYRKTHLWQDYELQCFEPGPSLESFTLKSFPQYRFGTLICYDVEFPELARELCLQGVSVLIVHTALGAGDAANIVPNCVIPTRASENHMFVAYSNFCGMREKRGTIDDEELAPMCGLSGIFAPDGHTIARASENQTQLLIGECKPAAFVTHFKHTPYLPDRRVELIKLHSAPRKYDFTPMTRDEIREAKEKDQSYGDDKFMSQIISMQNER